MTAPVTGAGRTSGQTLAMLVGVTFLLIGILGFIPGITTRYGDLTFARDSAAKLLGIFRVSILHNIVHLLYGVVGLYLARTWTGARRYLIGGGIAYLVLWLLGLLNGADWLAVNTADNWLHFGFGIAMIGLGSTMRRARHATT